MQGVAWFGGANGAEASRAGRGGQWQGWSGKWGDSVRVVGLAESDFVSDVRAVSQLL